MRFWLSILVVVLVGCKDDPPPAPKKAPEPAAQVDEPSSPSIQEQREAFGLPLPPEIIDIRRKDLMIVAHTRLSLAEVAKFYEGKLPDHEVIEERRSRQYIPLRETLPELYAFQGAYSAPTRLRFRIDKPVIPPEQRVEIKPGDPVNFKLPDGRDLAPGAVYGEPYFPPPGSPLSDKRYRSNWGKPFGQWVPQ